MATIRAAIALYDGVTGPLQHMTRAMNIVLNSFEAMQGASGRAVDVASIQQAREELARTETALDGIEQSIQRARDGQQGFNHNLRSGSNAAGDLWSKLRGMAATVGGLAAARKAVDLSDQIAGGEARLSLIVDDGGSVAELEQKIMASAQRSRAGYLDTMQSVSKLGLLAGDAFGSNDELIRFAELMNKNFVIAGASQQEQASAMYQLNQALGSGRLQGDEYRSIIENAPLLAQSIEDYMRNVQGAEGSMKDWASEGLLTADVIKNALFSSADEVEARFEQMPKTWGQVWTGMGNKAISIFYPILQRMNDIANSDKFETATDGILNGLAAAATLAGFLFGIIVDVGAAFTDNWSWIAPIVLGIAAAYIILHGAMLAYNMIQAISNGLEAVKAARLAMTTVAQGAQTTATFAATAAQYGFNAALLACPLTWIILLVIALVAALFAVCSWIAKTTGIAQSGFGVIAGGVNVAVQAVKNAGLVVANVALGIWEALGAVCSNIGTAFHNVIANVQGWFFGLLSTALTVVAGICEALNKLPFVEFDYSGITSRADEYARKSAQAYGSVEDYTDIGAAFDRGFHTFDTFTDGWADEAFRAGANWGDGVADKVSSIFDFEAKDPLNAAGFGNMMDGIYSNTGETAGNTAAAKDALEISEEDLRYLRDIAEREAINRYTTAQITVEQHNENHIDRGADLDGIMEAWTADFAEKLDISAEGVHL